jgi:hypothetical protein
MRATLRSRLEKLEARVESKKPQLFRSGYLKTLPSDYIGERHVVIVKREPTGAAGTFEWCEFEERPGQAREPTGAAGTFEWCEFEERPGQAAGFRRSVF